jgi:hypothetical protein
MNITVIANPVYTITASAGTGGNIDPSGAVSVEKGYSQSFTITANTGYHIADVLVDGSSVGAVSSYTFNNVITGHTISASFAVTTYTITASAGNNGIINPSGAVSVAEGNNQNFTITANNGYHIADVLVDGSSVGAVSSYTFNNVIAGHTITATFAINTYTITASAGNNGIINPSGAISVEEGNNQNFTITANNGYHIADVLVDGSSVGAVSSYTFNNVIAGHTIAASFDTNTVSLPEETTNCISVGPNPFINTLTISTDYWEKAYYTLVSTIGNKIDSGPLTDKITELNLSELRSGVYILQLKVNEKVQTIQIVKQ